MSSLAFSLKTLQALPAPHGALTDHLLHAIAAQIIADGVAAARGAA
ncbi:hypothetical protein [Paraburkholderia youngii]